MRNDDNTTAESVDGIGQGVDCRDIETVGRLVKQQHVRALDGQKRENDTGLLTVGKCGHLRSLSLTSHTETAKLLSPVLVVLADVREPVFDEVEGRLGKIKLLSRVLRVDTKLQVSVARDDTACRAQLSCEDVEESRLSDTVGSDKGGTRVHIDTEVEVLVQVLGRDTRVGEGDVIERQHRRRQLLDIGEAEGEDPVDLDRLDEPISLHLVKNLLARLGLPDQIGVCTGRSDELLDVLDLVLLLLVRLGLVDLLLAAGLVVRVVVTTIVQELLHAHVDHVCAHTVQEIHRVGDQDEGAVPLLHVLLQPHTGLQVQMGGGVIEQQQRRLDEQSLGEGDTHTPSTGHILGLLLDGLLVETETSQDEGGADVESGRVHALLTLSHCKLGTIKNVSITYLVNVLKLSRLGAVLLENVLSELLETCQLVLGFADDPLEGAQLSLGGTLVQEVDVDVLRERELASSNGLEKSGLSATVLAQETVAATICDFERGVVEKDLSVEHKRGGSDLDVARSLERGKDTGGNAVGQTVLVLLHGELADFFVQLEILSGVAVDGRGLGGILGGSLGCKRLLGLALGSALCLTGGFRCGDHVVCVVKEGSRVEGWRRKTRRISSMAGQQTHSLYRYEQRRSTDVDATLERKERVDSGGR